MSGAHILDDRLDKLLSMLAGRRREKPEQTLAALIEAEVERVEPGLLDDLARPGGLQERLAKAMGWSALPKLTPEEERDLQARQEEADRQAREIYGLDEPGSGRAAA